MVPLLNVFFCQDIELYYLHEALDCLLVPEDEKAKNLLTLSNMAHGYWNQGAFALKLISISDHRTILIIHSFWQKTINSQTRSLSTIPFSTEGFDCNIGAFVYKAKPTINVRREDIMSAYIFEIKTNDLIQRLVLSFELLKLQWFLTRVVGMDIDRNYSRAKTWPLAATPYAGLPVSYITILE